MAKGRSSAATGHDAVATAAAAVSSAKPRMAFRREMFCMASSLGDLGLGGAGPIGEPVIARDGKPSVHISDSVRRFLHAYDELERRAETGESGDFQWCAMRPARADAASGHLCGGRATA